MTEFADINFEPDFIAGLPTALGEGYNDTALYENMPKTAAGVFKMAIDNKKALSKRLEGVIQKPVPSADGKIDPKIQSEYQTTLRKELGIEVPETPDKYELFRAKDLPDGLAYSDDVLKDITALAHKHGISNAFIKEASQLLAERQIGNYTAQIQAAQAEAQKAFETSSGELKGKWKGDDLPKNTRIALKALEEFADDDFKKVIKDNKLYENPTDLEAWRKVGILPRDLMIWNNIGQKSLSAQVLKGDTGGNTITATDELKKKAADFPPDKFPSLYSPDEKAALGIK